MKQKKYVCPIFFLQLMKVSWLCFPQRKFPFYLKLSRCGFIHLPILCCLITPSTSSITCWKVFDTSQEFVCTLCNHGNLCKVYQFYETSQNVQAVFWIAYVIAFMFRIGEGDLTCWSWDQKVIVLSHWYIKLQVDG